MKFSTRKLVYLAFLIALSIVLTRLGSIRVPIGGVEAVRIGFGGFPIILAGLVFGPMAGGIVGAIADGIGYFITPIGGYMPHFTLTSSLSGFIPGLVLFYIFRGKRNFATYCLAIAVGQIITSVILVPYFIHTLFGAPYELLLIPRVVGQAFHIPVYAYLTMKLTRYEELKLECEVC